MFANRFAFFDVDETLIQLKSMFSFREFYFHWRLGPEHGRLAEQRAAQDIQDLVARGRPRAEINRYFYRCFQGEQRTTVQAAVALWYAKVRTVPGFFIHATLQALRMHQAQGMQGVLVSGSCEEILSPLAAELGIQYLLVNRLDTIDDRYTGELLSPQTIGEGKRTAIHAFLARMNANGSACAGYGDHLSDLPLLEAVGDPAIVAGDIQLMAIAKERQWRILCA